MAVLRTQDQVHGWNWPYQVKAKDFDTVPTKVDDLSVVVQEGDVIIAASDGVLDNLFDHALQELVADQLPALFEGSPIACQAAVDALAQSIAQQASAVGLKRGPDAAGIKTPFMANAAEEGRQHVGGKLDDVAVVCGLVQSGERPPQRVGHNFKAGAPGAMSGMVAPTAPMGVPAAPAATTSLQAQVASAVASAPKTPAAAAGQAPAPSAAAEGGGNWPKTQQMPLIEELVKAAEERMKKAQHAGAPPGGAQMPGPPGGAQMPGPPGGAQMPGPPGGAQMPGPPGGAQMPGPPGGAQMPGPPVQPMSQRPLPLPDASPAAFAAAEQKFQQQLAGQPGPQPSAPGQLGPGPPMQQMAGPGGPPGMPQPMPGVPAQQMMIPPPPQQQQIPEQALSQSAQALAQAAQALSQAQAAQQQLAQQAGRPGQPAARPGQHKPIKQPSSAAERAAARDQRRREQQLADFGRG